MSSIKKTTAKATKSPAPATKEKSTTPAKPAAKKAVAKTVATKTEAATAAIVAAVTRVAVKPAAPAPAVAAPAAPAPAVAVKEVTSRALSTTITAKIDIGFGNLLYLRGEGPGLSWNRGVAMANVGADTWQLELAESARPFTFKFLVNDLTWSAGEDFTAAPGTKPIYVPTF